MLGFGSVSETPLSNLPPTIMWIEGAGVALLSGSADVSTNYICNGGVTASGATSVNAIYSDGLGGGCLLSGSADVDLITSHEVIVITTSGGVMVGGNGLLTSKIEGLGGIIVSGSSPVSVTPTIVVDLSTQTISSGITQTSLLVIPISPYLTEKNLDDYDPTNLAWMMEFFGNILGVSYTQIGFLYENSTDVIQHPQDKEYLPEASQPKAKTPEMLKYEMYAKRSRLLKKFQDESPANITYFH
jgi:hypothetical protein